MKCSLVMFKSDGTRLDIPLVQPRTVIGRMSGCDVRISINRVSREHCEILNDEEGLRYRDLNSSNGVVHNGAKTKKGALKAGDELVIGPVVFTVVVDGQPAKITPVRTILDEEEVVDKQDASHVGTLVGTPMEELAAPPVAPDSPKAHGGSRILDAIDTGSSGVSPNPVAAVAPVAAPPAKSKADELAAQKEGSSFAELGEEVPAEDGGFDFSDVEEGDDEEPVFTFD